MGITMERWGPAAWNTLHAFAHSLPLTLDERQQSDFANFLYLFGSYLPCPKCRSHFKEYLDTHVDVNTFRTRESSIIFLNEAHNDVNVRLGKRVFTLDEHMEVYKVRAPDRQLRSEHSHVPHELVALSVVVLAGIALGVRSMFKRKSEEREEHAET